MARIKRGGRELVVADSSVTEYLNQGYSVIDEKGNEIVQGKAIDYASAMRRIAELEAHDSALGKSLVSANERIKKLSAENKKLKEKSEAAVEEQKASS